MVQDEHCGPPENSSWSGGPPRASTGYLLARAGAHARREFARILHDHHVTAHHLGILMALDELGPASQQQVSDLVGVDTRNTTPLLGTLTERGLVAREQDREDRRRHVLTLTTAGRVLLAELLQASARMEEDLLGGLDASELAALHRMLLTVLR